ncbi:MAG: hypothetical protein H7330_11180, partial [Hymenobacteraceae bacterium]|nr:hypothetical protein [Hymenobacteraceae bacterium]
MNSPDPTSDHSAEDPSARFDAHLRHQLEYTPAPIAGGWERLRSRPAVPPEPPAPRGRGLRPFAAGLVVGGLL